jgi:hypothetical protein
MRETVRQNVLPVEDRLGILQAREQGDLGALEQELVPPRHGVQQRLELEILHQGVGIRRQLTVDRHATIAVHEQDPHEPSRFFRRSSVSPYLSAIAHA